MQIQLLKFFGNDHTDNESLKLINKFKTLENAVLLWENIPRLIIYLHYIHLTCTFQH